MRKTTQNGWSQQAGSRLMAAALAVVAGAAVQAANVTVTGKLKDQFYSGASRASVVNGTATLTRTSALNSFEAPADIADNYAQRVSGYFTPATSGKYTFIIASDDDSDLYLSSDATPGSAKLIAQQTTWGGGREWTTYEGGNSGGGVNFTQKRSDTWSPDGGTTVPNAGGISLTANKKYYISAVHHEGGGGDNLAVTFVFGGAEPVNGDASLLTGNLISADFANPTTLSITAQPADVKVAETATATFSVGVSTDSELSPEYQWQKDGADIPGATQASYSFQTTAADNGKKFSVKIKTPALGTLTVLSATSAQATLTVDTAVVVTGALKNEFFPGRSRADVNSGNAGAPASTSLISSFQTPSGIADNYVQRVSGYFTPAVTGSYVFFTASDDDSDFFISTDDQPANKRLVAQQPSWGNPLEWITAQGGGNTDGANVTQKRSDQWSPDGGTTVPYAAGISLVKGKAYYIEGVQHEGGGGDNFAATFKLVADADPDNNTASAFTGSLISTKVPKGEITISQQPVNTTATEGTATSFSINATATGVVAPTYQWQKATPGSVTFANIDGATGKTYKTALLNLPENGTKIRCVVTAPGSTVNSSEVTLTVVPDTFPPAIASVGALSKEGGSVEVGIIVDEALNTAASLATANFTLSSGSVTGATYVENAATYYSLQKGIVLTTTGLTPGNTYTLTVKNLQDLKGNKSPSTSLQFTVQKLTWAKIGDNHPFEPSAIAVGNDGVNLQAGGNAFWGSADDLNFAYEKVTGDFDKVVQIEEVDASSNWARAGLMVRETLANDSRYQEVHADPHPKKFDGTPSADTYETNRRLGTGGSTDSSGSGGTPVYPNVWVRLRRVGSTIFMYRSADGVTWINLGRTDFLGGGDQTDLPATLFVGPNYGPENGNIPDAERKLWAARFRNYGDFKPSKAAGKQTYSIGVNFGDNEGQGSIGWTEVAGVDAVAQSHWNSLAGNNSNDSGPVSVKADVKGVVTSTSTTVAWDGSGNTWASTGRGEENNVFTGSDRALMAGYLDTGGATTTLVTVSGLPAQLTGSKYDVVVYALGGVAARGGGYRVTDLAGNELSGYQVLLAPNNLGTFKQVVNTAPGVATEGNFVLFKGLSAKDVIIEATTANGFGQGGTPRAPINAIQFVTPSGLLDAVVVKPTISIDGTGKITFVGKLQQSDSINGTFTEVTGATSPYTIPGTGAGKFYRTAQ